MRVVFFGSGAFALPALERLAGATASHRLLAVVTRPARPGGRGKKLKPTPVYEKALALGLPCESPASVNDPAYLETLAALAPDLFVVVDYGEILAKRFRELARIGAFNLHASLLPRYRGAAPVAHALLAGETRTGVTLFRIEKEIDSGPIVGAAALEVGELETTGELEGRLAELAASLLEHHLQAFASGSFTETPQDASLATFAPKLVKNAGLIDWNRTPGELTRFVRAMNPWPGAYSFLQSPGKNPERTIFLRVRPAAGAAAGPAQAPGTVAAVEKNGFHIRCHSGAIEVLELQRAGKAPLDAASYLRGRNLVPGDRFGGQIPCLP
jgi:methionyl-tRNA formyltransferase